MSHQCSVVKHDRIAKVSSVSGRFHRSVSLPYIRGHWPGTRMARMLRVLLRIRTRYHVSGPRTDSQLCRDAGNRRSPLSSRLLLAIDFLTLMRGKEKKKIRIRPSPATPIGGIGKAKEVTLALVQLHRQKAAWDDVRTMLPLGPGS